MFAAVNGDLPPDNTPEQDDKIVAGLEALGPHLAPDFGDNGEGECDFMRAPANGGCACCHSKLDGAFYRFAILGE